jgi:hypothetical protein
MTQISDLSDLSVKRLDHEFERLANLRDQCEAGMRQIREELSRRRDAEIAELKAQLGAQEPQT